MDGWREGRSDESRVCFEFCQELCEGPGAPLLGLSGSLRGRL